MKEIVFYSERWLDGGIENLIINIISKSTSKKYKYKIIVGQKETTSYDRIIKDNNVEFVEMHKKIRNPIIRTIISIFKFYSKIKNEENSIIHINVYNSIGLFFAMFVKNKENVVIHAHNNGIDRDRDRFYIKRISSCICRFLFTRKGYNYVACSELAANFCFNTKKINNYYIMNNGINCQEFKFDEKNRKKIREKLGINEGTILVGNVGRFVYQKNHDFLIDVFNKYLKQNANSRLLLIGSGPLENKLRNKVRNLGIEENVIFIGNTNVVSEYMSAMDIFLFPSIFEGLGIALIEAQCSGLKCITTNAVSGLVKVTDNIIFLELDVDLWIKRMKEISFSRRKDMSLEIKEKGFDIFDSVSKLEREYEVIFSEAK